MNYIILLGKPGSGKGTLASKLIHDEGYYCLSGSDLLKENSKDSSAKYYKEAKHALETGILISSDIINGMVQEKLKTLKNKNIIFDGYPRTIEQADFLIQSVGKENYIQGVYLDIEDLIIKERILLRLTCKECNASFNEKLLKPKISGVCDFCGGELHKRVDDNEKTLKVRLEQYRIHTFPVIEKLRKDIPFQTIKKIEELSL